MSTPRRRPRVIIIGAGAAGLSAARRLVDCGKDDEGRTKNRKNGKKRKRDEETDRQAVKPDVLVLEARERAGGRVLTKRMRSVGVARDGKRGGKSHGAAEPEPLPEVLVDVGASVMHGCADANQSVFRKAVSAAIRAPPVAGGAFYECTEHARWFGSDGRAVETRVIAEMHALFWLIGRVLAKRAAEAPDQEADMLVAFEDAKREVLRKMTAREGVLTEVEEKVLEKIRIRSYAYCSPMEEMGLHQAAVGADPADVVVFGDEGEKGKGGAADAALLPRSVSRATVALKRRLDKADWPLLSVASRKPFLAPDRLVIDGYTPFLIDSLKEGLDIRYETVVEAVEYSRAVESEDGYAVCVRTKSGDVFEADFVVVTLPIGVLKATDPRSAVTFAPPLSEAKQRAIDALGMGVHNKVILRFHPSDVFWPPGTPQINCLDPRFQFLNLNAYGKPGVLMAHVFGGNRFAYGYDGMSDAKVVAEVLTVLRRMFYGDAAEGAECADPSGEARGEVASGANSVARSRAEHGSDACGAAGKGEKIEREPTGSMEQPCAVVQDGQRDSCLVEGSGLNTKSDAPGASSVALQGISPVGDVVQASMIDSANGEGGAGESTRDCFVEIQEVVEVDEIVEGEGVHPAFGETFEVEENARPACAAPESATVSIPIGVEGTAADTTRASDSAPGIFQEGSPVSPRRNPARRASRPVQYREAKVPSRRDGKGPILGAVDWEANRPPVFPTPVDTIVTRWDQDPFSMGSYSFLPRGANWDMLGDMAAPEPPPETSSVSTMFFAGEHCDDLGWQCVHGACESGTKAADLLLSQAEISAKATETSAKATEISAKATEISAKAKRSKSVAGPSRCPGTNNGGVEALKRLYSLPGPSAPTRTDSVLALWQHMAAEDAKGGSIGFSPKRFVLAAEKNWDMFMWPHQKDDRLRESLCEVLSNAKSPEGDLYFIHCTNGYFRLKRDVLLPTYGYVQSGTSEWDILFRSGERTDMLQRDGRSEKRMRTYGAPKGASVNRKSGPNIGQKRIRKVHVTGPIAGTERKISGVVADAPQRRPASREPDTATGDHAAKATETPAKATEISAKATEISPKAKRSEGVAGPSWCPGTNNGGVEALKRLCSLPGPSGPTRTDSVLALWQHMAAEDAKGGSIGFSPKRFVLAAEKNWDVFMWPHQKDDRLRESICEVLSNAKSPEGDLYFIHYTNGYFRLKSDVPLPRHNYVQFGTPEWDILFRSGERTDVLQRDDRSEKRMRTYGAPKGASVNRKSGPNIGKKRMRKVHDTGPIAGTERKISGVVAGAPQRRPASREPDTATGGHAAKATEISAKADEISAKATEISPKAKRSEAVAGPSRCPGTNNGGVEALKRLCSLPGPSAPTRTDSVLALWQHMAAGDAKGGSIGFSPKRFVLAAEKNWDVFMWPHQKDDRLRESICEVLSNAKSPEGDLYFIHYTNGYFRLKRDVPLPTYGYVQSGTSEWDIVLRSGERTDMLQRDDRSEKRMRTYGAPKGASVNRESGPNIGQKRIRKVHVTGPIAGTERKISGVVADAPQRRPASREPDTATGGHAPAKGRVGQRADDSEVGVVVSRPGLRSRARIVSLAEDGASEPRLHERSEVPSSLRYGATMTCAHHPTSRGPFCRGFEPDGGPVDCASPTAIACAIGQRPKRKAADAARTRLYATSVISKPKPRFLPTAVSGSSARSVPSVTPAENVSNIKGGTKLQLHGAPRRRRRRKGGNRWSGHKKFTRNG